MFYVTSLCVIKLPQCAQAVWCASLVPRPCAPPGEKRSGEQSQTSWAYSPKVVMTNESVRLVIITCTSLTTLKFVHLHLGIRTFFERVGCKMFWSLLGYVVEKAGTSPRNLTRFTRPFLLVRGWGLGTRLVMCLSTRLVCMYLLLVTSLLKTVSTCPTLLLL